MSYRPDELSSMAESEREKKFQSNVSKGVKTAIGIGTSLTGVGLGARIAPFLSELIPADIALKGISKISPKIGNFLQKGMQAGLNVKDGLNFIKDKLESKDQPKSQPQQPQNIIEEHAPEVHEILKDRIGQGLKPLAVAYQVAKEGKFKKQIADLQKKTGKSFGDLVSSVFGGEEKQPQQSKPLPSGDEGIQQLIKFGNEQQSQNNQPQQTQIGPGQQALMKSIQELKSVLGRNK